MFVRVCVCESAAETVCACVCVQTAKSKGIYVGAAAEQTTIGDEKEANEDSSPEVV